MTHYDVDLFVIGAGSGGVRAARIAASYGAKVAVAEEFRVGGTCVIRGCVPKKLMVLAGRFRDSFQDAKGFGWDTGGENFHWDRLRETLQKETARLENIYQINLGKAGVTILKDSAYLIDPHTVCLSSSNKKITAERVLIATGAEPVLPSNIPGIEFTKTSDEIFDHEALPSHITILGGGYIALEFASIFNSLGCEVTVIHRGDKVLRGFDEDIRIFTQEALGLRGLNFKLNTDVSDIKKLGNAFSIYLNTGEVIQSDLVLSALGRRPKIYSLGLEALGVAIGKNNEVLVDAYSQTNIPSIYAVGDVTNRMNLTPVAIREGHAFADTVFGKKATRVDYSLIPTAVFTTPEIGVIGLSEKEARENYSDIKIFKTRFKPMISTLSGREERIFMKIVVNAQTDRVLGVHILGSDAGEIIQSIGVAVTMGATKADFDRTIALHPSVAEELVTMRDPASD